jgi:hypothetical protein
MNVQPNSAYLTGSHTDDMALALLLSAEAAGLPVKQDDITLNKEPHESKRHDRLEKKEEKEPAQLSPEQEEAAVLALSRKEAEALYEQQLHNEKIEFAKISADIDAFLKAQQERAEKAAAVASAASSSSLPAQSADPKSEQIDLTKEKESEQIDLTKTDITKTDIAKTDIAKDEKPASSPSEIVVKAEPSEKDSV